MKRVIVSALFLLLLSIFEACLHTQIQRQPAAGDNLGFEITEHGLPSNWIIYNPPKCEHTVYADTSEYKEGSHSLRFDITTCTEEDKVNFTGFTNEFMELTRGGGKYHVSFWLRNQGTQMSIYINGVRAKGAGEQPIIIDVNDSFSEWKQFETDVAIDPDMWLRLELQVRGKGSCWIDDVKIEKTK